MADVRTLQHISNAYRELNDEVHRHAMPNETKSEIDTLLEYNPLLNPLLTSDTRSARRWSRSVSRLAKRINAVHGLRLHDVAKPLPAGKDYECPICMNTQTKNKVFVQTRCMHVLHRWCLQRLLNSEHEAVRCPMCRAALCANKAQAGV